jgi:hypothetical protein
VLFSERACARLLAARAPFPRCIRDPWRRSPPLGHFLVDDTRQKKSALRSPLRRCCVTKKADRPSAVASRRSCEALHQQLKFLGSVRVPRNAHPGVNVTLIPEQPCIIS